MVIKTTSVKVDEDLWKLAKKKGYKLQDIINDALLSVCMIELDGSDLISLEKQLEDSQSEIELVEKTKNEKIEEITKEYDVKIMELKLKINSINKKIERENENLRIKKERDNQKSKLMQMFYLFAKGVLLHDEKLVKLMIEYSNGYGIDIKRVRQMVEKSQYKSRKDLPGYANNIIDGKIV